MRILIAGDKAFTDMVSNSYENRDIVAMLCGDGEMSLTYHTLDPHLPMNWLDYDALVVSAKYVQSPEGQWILNDRTDKSPTMVQFLTDVLIVGQMNTKDAICVQAFDDHGDVLRHIMEDML